MMITEDGTGVTNADSYCSADDLTTYCQTRKITLDVTPDVAVSMLLRATDYIEQTYRPRARPLTTTQGLQFPTIDPRSYRLIKRAVIFFALETETQSLTTRIEQTVKRSEEKLDGVGLTITEYDGAAPLDHYPQITAMIRDVASLRNASVSTGRVTRDPLTDPLPPLDASQGLSALDVARGFGFGGWGAFSGWDSLQ